jgi:hypothetical protein
MRRAARWSLVVVLVLAAGGAAWHWVRRERADLPPGLPEVVRAADRVVLFEGLPHQGSEPDRLAEERQSKRLVELGGFPFYERPLEWRGDDARRLTAWLTDPTGISTRRAGEGSCGEFHPDYAVVWEAGDARAVALVCLTCAEVRLFGPGDPGGTLYRFERSKFEVRDLLGDYRGQRPAYWRFWEGATR